MANEFNSLQSELIEQRNRVHHACRLFNQSPSKGNLKRLQKLFGLCGEQLFIESGFHCDYGDRISLGNRVYINLNCTFIDGGNITIGDDALLGPGVQILTINHPLSPAERLNKTSYASDVVIGNNVWIGAASVILPGASIGDGAVVGAASVVTGSLEANSLYIGNPARKVRALD